MFTKMQAHLGTSLSRRYISQHLKAFATVDPLTMNQNDKGQNLVKGQWQGTEKYEDLVDPMSGKVMMKVPATSADEIAPFIESLLSVPKTGLHNPFKNKERYLMLSEVNRKVVEVMHDKEVFDFFVKGVQRCCPKSHI